MSQQTENLIESDHIEEVLEKAGPPPPVVVVQYRNRVTPWVLVIALMGAALTLGGMFARNRREAERYRQQVYQARDDLERLRARAPVETSGPRPAAVDRPGDAQLAMAKDPGAADPGKERPVPLPAAAGPSATTRASDATPPEKPQAPAPAATEKATPSPNPDPALATVQLPAKADPAPTSTAPSPANAAPPAPAPPPSTAPRRRVVTLAGVPEGSSPFDEPAAAGAAGPGPGPTGPAVPPTEPPLPSREETERQIREEAARRQQENNQRLAQQQQDLHTLQEDERRQFLDELRMTLKVHGRRAGPEIEELSIRAGRDEDPVKLMQARRVIGSGRQSQRAKVYQLRAIGVSESVILDYLANEIDRDRGARNGPRSRDEVWIKAAQTLLRYEPLSPRSGDVPPAAGRPASGPAAARPAGDTSRAP